MSENNGSAWPNQAGQGASGPFQNQAGDSSAWNGYGQQQPQQQYPQSNGAPYYGQPQYGQGQYGNGGPYGPGGPGGPGAMGGPQKKFPWVPVIVGLIAVIAIVVGVLFATGVVGGSDDPDPTPTPSVTVAPQPTTPEPSPTITPTPEPSPDTTTATSSNTNGQNADGSVNVGQWKVELIEFQKDGEDQVAKTGETDIPELEDGRQWAAAKVKLTNIGDEAASPASEVGITLDTDSGEEIWEEFGFYGDESVRGLGEIQPGESVESWFYMDIPSDMESANVRFFDYLVPENVDTDITVK